MKKIIVSIIIIGLLLSTAPFSIGGKETVNGTSSYVSEPIQSGLYDDFDAIASEVFYVKMDKTEDEILREIENTSDKSLVVDEVIGERYVKYWEHKIDGVQIKNDYILLHRDIHTNNIVTYIREWREINIEPFNFEYEYFETENIFWKEKVIFLDESDKTYFYSFDGMQEYPIACWEVGYTDGTTILYDLDGNQIGHGIPAPSECFSLSGYNNGFNHDPWKDFRLNADYWFSKWCSSTVSISFPTTVEISSYVQDPDVEYFYESAHGGEYYFIANSQESYYASNVHTDMLNRQPMKFAFIGSCGGMDSVGPGTFSYEFRKGQMTNTVTVGYHDMKYPGWLFALNWQNLMFQLINAGYTIWLSFELATARYPLIAPSVVFVGDKNLELKVKNNFNFESDVRISPIIMPKDLENTITADTSTHQSTTSATTHITTSQNGISNQQFMGPLFFKMLRQLQQKILKTTNKSTVFFFYSKQLTSCWV